MRIHKEQRMQTYKSRKYQKYLCNIIHLNLTKSTWTPGKTSYTTYYEYCSIKNK